VPGVAGRHGGGVVFGMDRNVISGLRRAVSMPAAVSTLEAGDRTRHVVLLLSAILCLRLLIAWWCPLELCPDEAYYWDWSRQLSSGYYSKPPGIAWLIAGGTQLAGQSEFGVRWPAAVLGTLGLWGVYGLGRRLFGPATGVASVIAVALTPGMVAMNLLMTIDAPFLCCWACTLWCLSEWFFGPRPVTRWVCGAILCTGLGLLFKQTMIAVFPLTVVWLMLERTQRWRLRTPALWLWMIGSITFLLPTVWWNRQHGWLTVQHTREHFRGELLTWGEQLRQCVEFWLGQMGVVSPGLWLAATITGMLAVRTWNPSPPTVRLLLCWGFFPILAVAGLSLTQKVQPNWPAAFALPGLVLLAAWSVEQWSTGTRWDRCRSWYPWSLSVAGLMSAGLLFVVLGLPSAPWTGSSVDLAGRLRGWQTFADDVEQQRSQWRADSDLPELQGTVAAHSLHSATTDSSASSTDHSVTTVAWSSPETRTSIAPRASAHLCRPMVIAATGRSPVSQLAFYLPDRPRVYRWSQSSFVESQHEVWGGPPGPFPTPAVVITEGDQPIPLALQQRCSDIRQLGVATLSRGTRRHARYQCWSVLLHEGWTTPGELSRRARRSESALQPHSTPNERFVSAQPRDLSP
jgi:hypothetical protein